MNLSDVNTHLFAQLNRLSATGAKGEQLAEEIERAKAVSSIAKDIAGNAKLELEAHRLLLDYGRAPSSPPEILGISNEQKKKA